MQSPHTTEAVSEHSILRFKDVHIKQVRKHMQKHSTRKPTRKPPRTLTPVPYLPIPDSLSIFTTCKPSYSSQPTSMTKRRQHCMNSLCRSGSSVKRGLSSSMAWASDHVVQYVRLGMLSRISLKSLVLRFLSVLASSWRHERMNERLQKLPCSS